MKTFFSGTRSQFFRPLHGKYREVVASCIAALYRRQFTSLTDYGQSLSRRQVLDSFTDITVNNTFHVVDDSEAFAAEPRKLATWVFSQLRDTGWIDERADAVSMTSTYGLSNVGRSFAQVFAADQQRSVRTYHRNTRNTKNTLKAFAQGLDIHDLLDACEYSERIVADFSDVITELEERRNLLIEQVKQGNAASLAADDFFDFLERRFEPDLSVRLSTDSVERYRDEIIDLIQSIRTLDRSARLQIERDLRALKLEGFSEEDIWYEQLLKMIEQSLRNACDIMLPAVREALTNSPWRADASIRQLASVPERIKFPSTDLVAKYGTLSKRKRAGISALIGERMNAINVARGDPGQIRPAKRRQRTQLVQETERGLKIERSAQFDIYLRQVLDNAFSMGASDLKDALLQMNLDSAAATDDLTVATPSQLLAVANVVAAGAGSGVEPAEYELVYADSQTSDEYFNRRDVFKISRRENNA